MIRAYAAQVCSGCSFVSSVAPAVHKSKCPWTEDWTPGCLSVRPPGCINVCGWLWLLAALWIQSSFWVDQKVVGSIWHFWECIGFDPHILLLDGVSRDAQWGGQRGGLVLINTSSSSLPFAPFNQGWQYFCSVCSVVFFCLGLHALVLYFYPIIKLERYS